MSDWPELPYDRWRDTKQTLHMYLQVIGKLRLALSPPEPQWAHVPLYTTARGLTTSPLPHPNGIFDVDVDLVDHHVSVRTGDGTVERLALEPRTVADFYAEFLATLERAGVPTEISPLAVEVPDPIPFPDDRVHASYDPEWVTQFHDVLLRVDAVLKEHRARWRGRVSPVHFFWGSFDLAYTRFSGRPVEPAGGGEMMRQAHDAEQSCCGFWAGDDANPAPAFFAYFWPQPAGIEEAERWNAQAGEFLLGYDEARTSEDPRRKLLDFLDATYRAGAERAGWPA